MSHLQKYVDMLENGQSDDRTQHIYSYFKLLRQEERIRKSHGSPIVLASLEEQKKMAFQKATALSRAEVESWIDTPVEDMQHYTRQREGYRQFPIDTNYFLFSEKCVDVRDIGLAGSNFYYGSDENTYPYHTKIEGATPHLLVRDTVAHFLKIADAMLEKVGLGLFVYDGWRPPGVQAALYKWFEADLKAKNPGLEGEALEKEVIKFVSKPPADGYGDPLSPAPHLTGGAVDIAIIDRETGKLVFSGVDFDEFSHAAAPDFFEKKRQNKENMSEGDTEALKSIRIAFHLMSTVGFVPLDSENWHFEMFTQYWAKAQGLDAAFYGAVKPDLTEFENRPWVERAPQKPAVQMTTRVLQPAM